MVAQVFIKTVTEECGKKRIQLIHYHPENLSPEILATGILMDEANIPEPDAAKKVYKRALLYYDDKLHKVYIEYLDKAEYVDKAVLQAQVDALSAELINLGKTAEEVTQIKLGG